jgi:hypothetical protein
LHSTVAQTPFRGVTVNTYDFPTDDDVTWSDIYCPNNTYAAANTVHQVNDDETPYIQSAFTGKTIGSNVRLTVFGHTTFVGNGPFTADVYDYSGRFLTLTLNSRSDEKSLDSLVPGFAVLAPSTIVVTLTSDPRANPYQLAATYRAAANR